MSSCSTTVTEDKTAMSQCHSSPRYHKEVTQAATADLAMCDIFHRAAISCFQVKFHGATEHKDSDTTRAVGRIATLQQNKQQGTIRDFLREKMPSCFECVEIISEGFEVVVAVLTCLRPVYNQRVLLISARWLVSASATLDISNAQGVGARNTRLL